MNGSGHGRSASRVVLGLLLAVGARDLCARGSSSQDTEQGVSGAVAIRVRLEQDAGAAEPRLRVAITARGLPARGRVTLELDGWGGWHEIEADYLQRFEGSPAARREAAGRYVVAPPPDWDGTGEWSYEIPCRERGSELNQRCGLGPWTKDQVVRVFTTNTLMEVRVDGEPWRVPTRLELEAPEETPIATGWGGLARGAASIDLDGPPESALLVFGEPLDVARAEATRATIEAFQYGAGKPFAGAIADLVQRLERTAGGTTKAPPSRPLCFFLFDTGGGGTRVDHGFEVGYAAEEADPIASLEQRLVTAHEFFHLWMGGLLSTDGETFVWIKEGWNDYLSIWHAAAAGVITREEFASRFDVYEQILRGNSANGRIAFGDPAVNWRDGDGPNETLAYKGGAILAFALDVELRRLGFDGLHQLVADWLSSGEHHYTIGRLEEWIRAHDLGDFYEERIARPAALPAVGDLLSAIGFAVESAPAPLTYLGITTDRPGPFGLVTAVDADGPAAAVGMKVGDRITGFFPTRGDPVAVGADVTTPFRFGLEWFEPDRSDTYIGVARGAEALQLPIRPRTIPGGERRVRVVGDRAELDAFFGIREAAAGPSRRGR